jgi:glycosyltransferase involved in cell wall biosynthesis
VALGCRRGTEAKVVDRARREGVVRVETFGFSGGAGPDDVRDVRRLVARLRDVDVVHVHRGKEHWLAAIANRLTARPRPLVRTRHIAQAVRPHAANGWLYRRATASVVTVTEAIRRQYLAAGLVDTERVVTLSGGADAELFRPRPRDGETYRRLGGGEGPLVGMIAGLRVMKGHRVVVDAAAGLARTGIHARFVFVGQGPLEGPIRAAIRAAGLEGRFAVVGWADDLPATMAALDLGLYTPLESDGMSRVVFEYLAAGRPLIAARVGVVPEVLTDGEHALLVPAGDAEALAGALRRGLTDPELRERLGRAGRRLIEERYSGERLAAALEALYERLLAA